MLIDTHCHLDFKDFDGDREEVIRRARDGGVRKFVNIGCNLERAKKSLEIAKKHGFIFTSVGLHPQEAELGDEKFFEELKKLLKEPKVVAIGECGLEFFGELELAREYRKPVIIHSRRAYPEIIEILKEKKKKNPNLSGVVHCFVGRLSQAEEFLKLGFLISFTGIITYARDYDKVIKSVPLEKIMVETDAPFIAPLPYRDQRNEPLYVKYVAKKIAELKELDFYGVAEITTKNAETLFGI
jgi:TatD DNase family protein